MDIFDALSLICGLALFLFGMDLMGEGLKKSAGRSLKTTLGKMTSSKLKGILLGILLIPTLFYTLNGAFGKTPDWINIALFFVSAAVAYVYETRQFSLGTTPTKHPKRGLVILVGIAALFVLFTFMTPTIPLFKDPMTGVYGLGK